MRLSYMAPDPFPKGFLSNFDGRVEPLDPGEFGIYRVPMTLDQAIRWCWRVKTWTLTVSGTVHDEIEVRLNPFETPAIFGTRTWDASISMVRTLTPIGLSGLGAVADEIDLAVRGVQWVFGTIGDVVGEWTDSRPTLSDGPIVTNGNMILSGTFVLGTDLRRAPAGTYHARVDLPGLSFRDDTDAAHLKDIAVVDGSSQITVFGDPAPYRFESVHFLQETPASMSATIAPASYWEYRDQAGENPLWDAGTGAKIGFWPPVTT